MISVILPTYRNPDYLDLCLRSIVENQVNKNDIIVIVDGYFEESEEVLKKYADDINVIDLEENMGMQHAINVGVWNAQSDWIFVINDDNVFPSEWDKRLVRIAEYNTVWTVNQIEPTGPGMFNFPVCDCGQTVEDFEYEIFLDIEKNQSRLDLVTPDASIFPFFMNKKWYMAAGGFDTWYDSPNLCDWDFFAKLQFNPILEFKRTHRLHLYHFGSVATKKNAESESFRRREQFAAQQYEYKWGTPPFNGENNWKHREQY